MITVPLSKTLRIPQSKPKTSTGGTVPGWQAFHTDLVRLQSITQSLSSASALNTVKASIDQPSVASVTEQPGATAGSHTLTVKALAQAHKVLSSVYNDPSMPLDISGSFTLNGKCIDVASTDTLSGLVAKINVASCGVHAAVFSDAPGNYQLGLLANSSGALHTISASNVSDGSALESLGLLPSAGAVQALRQSVTAAHGATGAGSTILSNATLPVGTAMSLPSGRAAAGTVKINGKSVSLDLNTMSLTDIANAINDAGIAHVQALICGLPEVYGANSPLVAKQLQIVSLSTEAPLTASYFADDGGVLSILGILQTQFANQVSAAQDAAFTLDGVDFTRSSNTINDGIQSVSIHLLTTNSTPESMPAIISVTQDTTVISGLIDNFVQVYNRVIGHISGWLNDAEQQTALIFGDFTLISIQDELAGLLKATSGATTLASIGITVEKCGDLQVDSLALEAALTANPQEVARLFGANGTTSNENLSFIAASTKTQASGSKGYPVNIARPATQASITGSVAYQTLAQPETLTFTSGIFGSGAPKVLLRTGTTLLDAIAAINGDEHLSPFIYASRNKSGALVLSSKGYGSADSFSIASDRQGAGTTGLGTVMLNATGADVDGTINGEIATGSGQSLTGCSGNNTTDGVQILYTGTGVGDIGTVSVTQGIANQLHGLISRITDPVNGSISTTESSINTQITGVQTQISIMQNEIGSYHSYLNAEFSHIEASITKLQQQQQTFHERVSDPAPKAPRVATKSTT